MKKLVTTKPFILQLAVLISVMVLISCKKEATTPASVVNPVGYWNGNAAHHHTAILNKADGSSRIYFRIFGTDTASATIGDGSYTMTGNKFKASYLLKNSSVSIFIEGKSEQAEILKGYLYNSITSDIVDCSLQKQN